MDLGADDFSSDDEMNYTIFTSPELFGEVSKGLESTGVIIESGELTLEPQNIINISTT